MPSKNYLTLDIGSKRIGLAVGSLLPFGRGWIDVQDDTSVLEHVAELIKSESISDILIGLPEVKSGEETESYKLASEWREKLRVFNLPLHEIDESYSSVEAERQLREEGTDFSVDKGKVDERAAMVILEHYLHLHSSQ